MLRLMKERGAVRVVADQRGSPTAAASVARAIWRIVERPEVHGVLHWTDAGAASWYDFARAIAEEATEVGLLPQASDVNADQRPRNIPTAARRPFNSVLDMTAKPPSGSILSPRPGATMLRTTLRAHGRCHCSAEACRKSIMARLLVTGGAGFIGTNFVHYWLREHPADLVVVLDALTYAGNRANLEPVEAQPELPLRSRQHLRHAAWSRSCCASTSSMSSCTLRPNRTSIAPSPAPMRSLRRTSYGTHSMLKAARQVWLEEKSVPQHRFHQVSTDEVYGSLGPEDAPFTETTPYAPNSPYSASKAASDHLVRAYHHTYGLATTISNCSNNYGPYQFPEKLIPLIITPDPQRRGAAGLWRRPERARLAARGGSLPRDRSDPGQGPASARSTTSAANRNAKTSPSCASCAAMIDEKFAARARTARSDFRTRPARVVRASASLISFVTDRLGHDRRYAIDGSKIERELGFRPRHEFGAGLSATLDWYLERRR